VRAPRAAVHRRRAGAVLVLAPTGKAVDVAVCEGAGDKGLTIAKALQLLRDNELEFGEHTLVIVDEAAMVGTVDLGQHASGRIMVTGQNIKLGPRHRGKIVTVVIEDTHLHVLHGEEEIAVRRRNLKPITRFHITGAGANPTSRQASPDDDPSRISRGHTLTSACGWNIHSAALCRKIRHAVRPGPNGEVAMVASSV
jgi:hypothetical protein